MCEMNGRCNDKASFIVLGSETTSLRSDSHLDVSVNRGILVENVCLNSSKTGRGQVWVIVVLEV